MLDPYYLAHCTDEIEVLFADLETSILEDIARRIHENKYETTSTAQYQLNRAKALGLHDSEIKKQIADILKISEQRVSEIISSAAYEAVESDNLIFKEAYERKLINTFRYDKANLSKLILKGIDATNGEIRNICKTTAKTARKLLISSLDQTYLGIQSGAFSQQEAVGFAVDKVAKTGLQWIDYQSGTHRRPDSVIRNAIRSGVNQTACKCQEKNFGDLGGNLVATTSHVGARPEHAAWQGKVFWWKKKYKNYQNFEQATGYGTGAGLGGWNCRHSFFPYFEGLSNMPFEHYSSAENDARYELDQEQRYNERKIREWKRRQAVNKAGGVDNTREARKVREWQKRQADFLKAHPDMKRNYAREMIEDVRSQRRTKLKEFYATDDKSVKMKIREAESAISKNQFESAIAYDQKGNVIFKKDGEKHEVEFTIEELNKMKGAIVTHNHPQNTTFSPHDIYMLKDWKLQELRAAINKGSYVLRNNDKITQLPDFTVFQKEHEQLYLKYLKAYKNKYPYWKDDKNRMDRVVQNNVMNRLAKKYGLLYSFEEDAE